MELTIDKKRIAQTIDDLPEDTTIEEAIERLLLLHKIQTGLNEPGGNNQEKIEQLIKNRREKRSR